MVWAGTREGSTLATILTVFGCAIVGMVIPGMVNFPGLCRGIVSALLPFTAPEEQSLLGWRLLGRLGTSVGVLMVYLGVDAL